MTIQDKENAAQEVIDTFEGMTAIRQVENGTHYCDLMRLRIERSLKHNAKNNYYGATGEDYERCLLLRDAMEEFREGRAIHPLAYLCELVLAGDEVAWSAAKGFIL